MHQKNLKFVLLFDFYGPMLTQKQNDIFHMYYDEDYSLSEIAEEFNISRQGVHDLIKRTEKCLLKYEETLKLVERFKEQEEKLRIISDKAKYILNNEDKKEQLSKEIIDIVSNMLVSIDKG